jgi:hypothetical protein
MTLMISGGGGGGGATALSGLSDVTLGLLANGQILQYNSGSGQWENTALTGQLTYQGSFDASTGTPALSNALKGDFYVVSVAGTQFGRDWAIGDHLIVNADMGGVIDNSKIDKIDNTDAVSSVNGATGVVVLDSDDVAEGAANLYYTDARADARADARIAASNMTALADVSYTAGAGIDNYVLTYDHAAGGWRAEAAASAPVDSVNGATGVVVLDSDDVAEGAANLYYTDARADARADARIAASNMTALADVSYTAGAGIDNYVLTYDHAAGGWRAEPAASGGGSRPNVYTQSASFTIGDGTGTDPGAVTAAELERVYLINNGASAVTVTLPAISGNVGAGFKLQIKRLGTAAVTIDRNSEDIDDQATNQTLSVQYSSFTLVCAGAGVGWYII